MAEGGVDPLSESFRKLDEELTCPVCHDHFQEPKVLPCLHYYCKKCIANLIGHYSRDRNGRFNCPECRRDVQLPANAPESLSPAFFVNRMEDVFTVMTKAQPKQSVTCELCTKLPSISFCKSCIKYICENCVRAHRDISTFHGHDVVSMESLRTSMATSKVTAFSVAALEMKCTKHDGEPLKLYCNTCDKLICRDCIVIDHSGHKYVFVTEEASRCKTLITQKASSLENVSSKLKLALKSLNNSKIEMGNHNAATQRAIDAAQTKVNTKLQQKGRELKAVVSSKISKTTEEITSQEKNAELALGEVESLLELLHRNLEKATDQELLSLQKQMSDQGNRVAQLYANPAAKFPVPQLPQLEVQCSDDILQVLQDDFSLCDNATNPKGIEKVPKGSIQNLTRKLQQHVADSALLMREKQEAQASVATLRQNVEVLQLNIYQNQGSIQNLTRKLQQQNADSAVLMREKQEAQASVATSRQNNEALQQNIHRNQIALQQEKEARAKGLQDMLAWLDKVQRRGQYQVQSTQLVSYEYRVSTKEVKEKKEELTAALVDATQPCAVAAPADATQPRAVRRPKKAKQ